MSSVDLACRDAVHLEIESYISSQAFHYLYTGWKAYLIVKHSRPTIISLKHLVQPKYIVKETIYTQSPWILLLLKNLTLLFREQRIVSPKVAAFVTG